MQAHIYLTSYKHVLKRLNIGFNNSLVRYGEFSERLVCEPLKKAISKVHSRKGNVYAGLRQEYYENAD